MRDSLFVPFHLSLLLPHNSCALPSFLRRDGRFSSQCRCCCGGWCCCCCMLYAFRSNWPKSEPVYYRQLHQQQQRRQLDQLRTYIKYYILGTGGWQYVMCSVIPVAMAHCQGDRPEHEELHCRHIDKDFEDDVDDNEHDHRTVFPVEKCAAFYW